jgi:SAM-dependent methyltransferase
MMRLISILLAVCAGLAVGVWVGRTCPGEDSARVDPKDSVFYMPWDNLVNQNPEAKTAAGLLLKGLQTRDTAVLAEAKQGFKALEKSGNFGGEYGTLSWFSAYLLLNEQGRAAMVRAPVGARLVRYFEQNNWSRLKDYLDRKYGFKAPGKLRMHDELIRFNSPARASWERSDLILEKMDIQAGQHVADIGAGAGYFSFLFADEVGPSGRVLSVDLNRQHLKYIAGVAHHEGIDQIEIVESEGTAVGAPDGSLDFVFMCAAYQAIYAFEHGPARTQLLNNIRRALKPDGKLVIVDNSIELPEGVLPYRGILIAKKAVTGQLEAHGFPLLDSSYSVPQRYILVFGRGG